MRGAAGFQDAILLDQHGKVTEGPGYNVFVVRRGRVMTPAVTHGILEGVTRDTLIQLFARVHDVEVVEREIDQHRALSCEGGVLLRQRQGGDADRVGRSARDRLGRDRALDAANPGDLFEVAKGRRQEFSEWLLPVW